MNTLAESAPAVSTPETAFVLSLQKAGDNSIHADETFIPGRFALPAADGFEERGAQESAIND